MCCDSWGREESDTTEQLNSADRGSAPCVFFILGSLLKDQHLYRTCISHFAKLETLYHSTTSHFPLPSAPGSHHFTFSFFEFDYFRYLIVELKVLL